MTTPTGTHDELLWRSLDGALDPAEEAALAAALAADPALRGQLALMAATKAAVGAMPQETAPAELGTRIKAALGAEGAPVAATVITISPAPRRQWMALVAGLLLLLAAWPVVQGQLRRGGGLPAMAPQADSGTATMMAESTEMAAPGAPAPAGAAREGADMAAPPAAESLAGASRAAQEVTHEGVLFQEHRQAVSGQLTDLQGTSTYPAGEAIGPYGVVVPQVPLDRWSLAAWRHCVIVDCPAIQFFGRKGDAPVSYFVVPTTHFAPAASGFTHRTTEQGGRAFQVLEAPDGLRMVAWAGEGHQTHLLVSGHAPEQLMALASPSVAWLPVRPLKG
ncbi:MAG TPA: hypothetical protein VEI97_00645 [bacterium]|nr:hypothetical protein [bacterium]